MAQTRENVTFSARMIAQNINIAIEQDYSIGWDISVSPRPVIFRVMYITYFKDKFAYL